MKNRKKRAHYHLFNQIARIYGLFFNKQKRYYKKLLWEQKNSLLLNNIANALDIGCGTGALVNALAELGIESVGVDAAKGMLKIAKQKTNSIKASFFEGSFLEKLPYRDQSFDLVTAFFVAHGLKKEQRIRLYQEMDRLAYKAILIYDYSSNRALITDIIEWLEGGDYFNYVAEVEEELEKAFGKIEIILVNKKSAFYLVKKGI